jgi:hypothetical protein
MKKIIAFLIIIVALSSCSASLYPIVEESNVLYDHGMVGKWMSDGDEVKIDQYLTSAERLIPFGEGDSLLHPVTADQRRAKEFAARSYLISFGEKEGKYVYEARMTMIGKQVYAEILPYKFEADPDPFGNYENAHSIAKVDYSKNRIQLMFLDGQKIKDLVISGKLKISYEHEKLFNNFLITATTKELRSFLEKYGSDERLFNKKDVITLTR